MEQEIERQKNQSVANIEWAYDTISTDIKSATKELESINKDISVKTQSLIDIVNQENQIKEDIKIKTATLNTREDNLNIRAEEIKRSEDAMANKLEKSNTELNSLTTRIDTAKRTIADLNAEIEKARILADARVSIMKEITALSEKKDVLITEVHDCESKAKKIISDALDEASNITANAKKFVQEITEKQKDVMLRESALTERENTVFKGEQGLRTLTERYKKLFGDKGINVTL